MAHTLRVTLGVVLLFGAAVGAGATVPLTDEELDVAARISVFYHF